MFPFGKDKEIRKPSLFGDFDSFFAGFDEFDRYANEVMKEASAGKGNAYVYGYRAYTGADDKPVVEEYSNMPGFKAALGGGGFAGQSRNATDMLPPAVHESGNKAIEPYYDVLDEGTNVKVIVEMPGVEREQIKLKSTGRTINVDAQSEHRTYSAKIQTPDFVQAKPQKAQYKNGVLEITYAKADKATDVKVE
jgi:HSP20 family protein